MEFSEVISRRYSVRAYKSDDVPEDVLGRVLEAARLAPTAKNLQAMQFLVIHTKGREEELGRIYRWQWFVQPPLVICVCNLTGEEWIRRDGKRYGEVDVAIAMDHLILAAANEGLGTCWIGAFDAQAAKEVLGLPEGVEPIAFTPLGYPNDQPHEKIRKQINELVRYERW